MEQYDLMAIGDLATDAFIRIKDAEVHCDVNKDKCEICLRFGDKIPYESVTIVPSVGNSPNAAVGAARLGLRSALVSNIGADQAGEEAIEHLKTNGVATNLVVQNPGKKTNYHYVLWYQDDRTILVKHEDFDYELPAEFTSPSAPNSSVAKWIYLSSLGEHSLPFHAQIATYLATHPEVKLAFQPGTFQIKLGHEPLADIYRLTEIFFCNLTEAQRILKTSETDPATLLTGMATLGPKIVVISDGQRGAYALDSRTGEKWFMPIYPDPNPPVDRTGAGDSFSSTITSALILGKTLREALTWGPINSMSVVQQVGAQAGLLSREQLEKYLATAPADYQIKAL